MLDGKFAFILFDKKEGRVYAARDHMGICPLYIGYGTDGSVWFASEMKCFVNEPRIERYEIFPPGHYYHGGPGTPNALVQWYNPAWLDVNRIPTGAADLPKLRATLIEAVVKRLMADVPFGVLLSGGLDSSLVTAIAVRHGKSATNSLAWSEKVHSFSVGIKGAPDLRAARKVAAFLGTEHHEFTCVCFSSGKKKSQKKKETTELTFCPPPKIQVHAPRGAGRAARRDLPLGDVRAGARVGAHVPVGAQDQGHGRQNGAVRRRG